MRAYLSHHHSSIVDGGRCRAVVCRPGLLPVAIVAYVPIGLTSIRNSKSGHKMHYGLAELDRDRIYHARLLTGRVEAKEVRAFGLTGMA